MTAWFESDFPRGAKIAEGRWTITEALHGDPAWGIYRAVGACPAIVTTALRRGTARDGVAAKLAFPIEGVARVLATSTFADGGGTPYDVLVEAEPPGAPLTVRRPGDLRAVARGLVEIVARAHTAGLVLGTLRPELVYADADVCTGVLPRAEAFRAAAPETGEGFAPCFDEIYLSPEALAVAPTTSASDVFSLCATLVYLFDGAPPFDGDTLSQRMSAALHGAVRPVDVPDAIRAGLARDPRARPDSRALFEALSR